MLSLEGVNNFVYGCDITGASRSALSL